MQIFLLDYCPQESARILFDLDYRRAIKQILESVQALSDLCGNPASAYKPCNPNHPVVLWLKESEANVNWTINNLVALHDLYSANYGNKQHKSFTKFEGFLADLDEWICENHPNPSREMTEISFDRFNPLLQSFGHLPRPEAYFQYILSRQQAKVS